MKLSQAPLNLTFKFRNCKRKYTLLYKHDNYTKSMAAGTLSSTLYEILDDEGVVLLSEDTAITPASIKAAALSPGDNFVHNVKMYPSSNSSYQDSVMVKLVVFDKGSFGNIYYINPHTKALEYIDGETEVQVNDDFHDVPF